MINYEDEKNRISILLFLEKSPVLLNLDYFISGSKVPGLGIETLCGVLNHLISQKLLTVNTIVKTRPETSAKVGGNTRDLINKIYKPMKFTTISTINSNIGGKNMYSTVSNILNYCNSKE